MSHFYRVLGSGKTRKNGALASEIQLVMGVSHLILNIVTFHRSIQVGGIYETKGYKNRLNGLLTH
jgi:hypothetical protein